MKASLKLLKGEFSGVGWSRSVWWKRLGGTLCFVPPWECIWFLYIFPNLPGSNRFETVGKVYRFQDHSFLGDHEQRAELICEMPLVSIPGGLIPS
jgi:hypothetical protein